VVITLGNGYFAACALTACPSSLPDGSASAGDRLAADGGGGLRNGIGKDVDPDSFALSFVADIVGGLGKIVHGAELAEMERKGLGM